MATHSVVVGNIGMVTHTGTYAESEKAFSEYRKQSVTEYGRAAGESVTWFRDGEIYKEHVGKIDKGREA